MILFYLLIYFWFLSEKERYFYLLYSFRIDIFHQCQFGICYPTFLFILLRAGIPNLLIFCRYTLYVITERVTIIEHLLYHLA